MQIIVSKTPQELGEAAGKHIARKLREVIAEKGEARLALSTGMSQFETIAALVAEDVDWSRVTMFHLDEYVGLPETHIASFRKYLKERFAANAPGLKAAYYVNGEGDVAANVAYLNEKIGEAPIDVGVIGIGENAHIAFNDPPADFNRPGGYFVADLDERCRRQQVGEGWFATLEDVPKQAISMTVPQIMRCTTIITCVPHKVKAEAIRNTLTAPTVTPDIPATKLREHPDWTLYIDEASASLTPKAYLA